MSLQSYPVIVVGAGLSGATIAERYASDGKKVLVIDKRDHIAGNVYDEIDKLTGIRVSLYGAHLFHTNDEGVWSYVQRFGKWRRWDHKVVADVSGVYVPVPVNITTVNTLYGTAIHTEEGMRNWLAAEQVPCADPKNSEEVALSRVGERLYQELFKPYTMKQWAKEPAELEPSVLGRIPVRENFDDRYFTDKYQALPEDGYTSVVQRMLSHRNISVRLKTSWEEVAPDLSGQIIIFTGPIDSYFKNSRLPPLEYRSIRFEWSRFTTDGYMQPNSVVNYPGINRRHTRSVEYKHFLHQRSDWTIISSEDTCDVGEPYYPVPTEANQELYKRYRAMTENVKNVHFIGRLATYKYFNMDQAIRAALDYYDAHLHS
jgi:UDP-galactopyranose mutase